MVDDAGGLGADRDGDPALAGDACTGEEGGYLRFGEKLDVLSRPPLGGQMYIYHHAVAAIGHDISFAIWHSIGMILSRSQSEKQDFCSYGSDISCLKV